MEILEGVLVHLPLIARATLQLGDGDRPWPACAAGTAPCRRCRRDQEARRTPHRRDHGRDAEGCPSRADRSRGATRVAADPIVLTEQGVDKHLADRARKAGPPVAENVEGRDKSKNPVNALDGCLQLSQHMRRHEHQHASSHKVALPGLWQGRTHTGDCVWVTVPAVSRERRPPRGSSVPQDGNRTRRPPLCPDGTIEIVADKPDECARAWQ